MKQQKMPATNEIAERNTKIKLHLNKQFSFKFQNNLKIQNTYYVLKCESYTAQNW